MARMHTGKHGKSKSRKPDVRLGVRPEGIVISNEEVVKLITDYAKQGKHQAQIGELLKTKHGIPYVRQLFGKRLGDVLEENGFKAEIPQDMMDLLRKAITLRRHLERNHNDVHNRTRLNRVEAKIWRLSNYYKNTGAMPADWKYDPVKVALLIKS
jgi:small subunit ribosomal protein S15